MRDKSLRILYVLPYVPSPIRVRPFQLIRHLAQAGHKVTVAALADEFATEEALAELNSCCEKIHIVPHDKMRGALQALLALPSPMPMWAAYCLSTAMETLLRTLATSGEFDVAHVEHLRAAHFIDHLWPLPAILDAVDCITALQKQTWQQQGSLKSRLLSWEEWVKLRRYEPGAYRVFPQIAVTSDYDEGELRRLDETLPPITVIPNGVDTHYFQPDESIGAERETLVFSGKMSYHANEDAAHFLLTKVLPILQRMRPGVRLLLVGSKPSSALRALATRTDNVIVTGYVDDLRPYLSRATLAVCPMRIGVGIQNKALEAMAMGRPVVCSPIAARALSQAVEKKCGVYVAESAEAFAEICSELLTIPSVESKAMGQAARDYVEQYHQWPIAANDFVQLYEKAIAQ